MERSLWGNRCSSGLTAHGRTRWNTATSFCVPLLTWQALSDLAVCRSCVPLVIPTADAPKGIYHVHVLGYGTWAADHVGHLASSLTSRKLAANLKPLQPAEHVINDLLN